MTDTERDNAAAYGKIVAKAWRDPAFKAKLIADPLAVLNEAGMALPAGITVEVVENTDTHVYVVLPPKPAGLLSDEALDKAAGGDGIPPPENCLVTGPNYDPHCVRSTRP